MEVVCRNFFNESKSIDLISNNKKDVLYEIVKKTSKINESIKDTIVKELLEREGVGSTIIADRIALAHIESSLVSDLILSYGYLKNEILNWDLDEEYGTAKIIILLIFPKYLDKRNYIENVKVITKILSDENLTCNIIRVKNASEIKEIFINR